MTCQICQTSRGREHHVREMMFGTRELFRYFECEECRSLQLISPPIDLTKYYPPDRYYSLAGTARSSVRKHSIRRWLKRRRDAAVLFGGNWLTSRLARHRPNPGIDDIRRWISHSSVNSYRARILDVGCGRGQLLFRLAELGFSALTGVDPFIERTLQTGSVRLVNQSLETLDESQFDLVMMHHSLEHMPDQVAVLNAVRDRLTPEGICLIRTPIVSRGAWQLYGTDWAEIDAPRHFCVHSEMSLSLAASQAGLSLRRIEYEADPFIYRASEMYRRDLPLRSVNSPEEVFTPAELEEFERLAIRYNVPGWAGRAAFYLSRQTGGEEHVISVSLEGERSFDD